MKLPLKPKNLNQKKLDREKVQRESWHKLVVKIINWKDGPARTVDKITIKEWTTYCHKMLKTNTSYGKKRTQENLDETRELIASNDGFVKELP